MASQHRAGSSAPKAVHKVVRLTRAMSVALEVAAELRIRERERFPGEMRLPRTDTPRHT